MIRNSRSNVHAVVHRERFKIIRRLREVKVIMIETAQSGILQR
ncbi:hypothetical protein ACMYR2_3547 [Nitrobacter sp. TKz-YC01]